MVAVALLTPLNGIGFQVKVKSDSGAFETETIGTMEKTLQVRIPLAGLIEAAGASVFVVTVTKELLVQPFKGLVIV